ncbi:MAG: hypothetical protein WD894_25520 [Pirellulales bacterium]
MTRLLRLTALAFFLFCAPASADAASWIFQRSYYTHDPVTKVRIGPQATGGPYYSPVRGEFIRTGVRQLRSQIRVGGMVFDQYNEWDAWIQTGAQF